MQDFIGPLSIETFATKLSNKMAQTEISTLKNLLDL